MNKMILNIQLFALGAEGSMKYDGFSDTKNDYTVGVSANLDEITTAYSYLNGLCNTVGETVNSLSGIQTLPGISEDGEYESSLQCLTGGNGLVGISQSVHSARQRAENVIRAVIKAEGGSEEDFKDYINQINENFDNFFAGDLDEYIDNEFFPEIKNGKMNTHIYQNDSKSYVDTIKYEGEYLEFENEDGIVVKVPLAKTKYEDGKVVFEEMTAEEKEKYIPKVTEYYNSIMQEFDGCSDKFKDEIGDRVDSLTILYIDPESRSDIAYANGAAAYCEKTYNGSNHSNIVMFADQFVDVDNDDSRYNNDEVFFDYMVGAYIHECGHAYANNAHFLPDRDTNREWNTIYDQVSSDPANNEMLRDYSVSNRYELFADSTEYYFNDPDKLRMVDIDLGGYDTLYDYMDYILN